MLLIIVHLFTLSLPFPQIRGHNVAKLDPLAIASADLDSETPPELILTNYGLGMYLKRNKSHQIWVIF